MMGPYRGVVIAFQRQTTINQQLSERKIQATSPHGDVAQKAVHKKDAA